MDFKLVLEKLLTSFEDQNIRYALMGGFALGLWSDPRATVDIDFLVHKDDMKKVDTIMEELGYECRFKTENVTQYISPLEIFGEVDFIHAFRPPSLSMLKRVAEKKVFDETVTIKVLSVEDLIGCKVQGMANDESRKALDLSDIESLLISSAGDIDWSLIGEYFDLFGFNKLFNELKGKYGKDK
ncbi:MAG: nucleotidyl transferase AbiEii/AbiGii toxin family protein [Thermodesulfobacteriota bacterium]